MFRGSEFKYSEFYFNVSLSSIPNMHARKEQSKEQIQEFCLVRLCVTLGVFSQK